MFRFSHIRCFTTATFPQVLSIVQQRLEKQQQQTSTSSSSSASPLANLVLIDVRSAEEVQQLGTIPTALNIPLPILGSVLAPEGSSASAMSNDDFEDVYEIEKPDPKSSTLLFFCQAGIRSRTAAKLAEETLGFASVVSYDGSFADWAENVRKLEQK